MVCRGENEINWIWHQKRKRKKSVRMTTERDQEERNSRRVDKDEC